MLGLSGLGIADRNSVAGVVRVHIAARALKDDPELKEQLANFRIAVGARLVFDDGATPDILAYPKDRAGWGRLTRLLSLGKRRAEKGECLLGLPDLFEFIGGLNLIVMPPEKIEADKLHSFARTAERESLAQLGLARRIDAVSRRRCAAAGETLRYRNSRPRAADRGQ